MCAKQLSPLQHTPAINPPSLHRSHQQAWRAWAPGRRTIWKPGRQPPTPGTPACCTLAATTLRTGGVRVGRQWHSCGGSRCPATAAALLDRLCLLREYGTSPLAASLPGGSACPAPLSWQAVGLARGAGRAGVAGPQDTRRGGVLRGQQPCAGAPCCHRILRRPPEAVGPARSAPPPASGPGAGAAVASCTTASWPPALRAERTTACSPSAPPPAARAPGFHTLASTFHRPLCRSTQAAGCGAPSGTRPTPACCWQPACTTALLCCVPTALPGSWRLK